MLGKNENSFLFVGRTRQPDPARSMKLTRSAPVLSVCHFQVGPGRRYGPPVGRGPSCQRIFPQSLAARSLALVAGNPAGCRAPSGHPHRLPVVAATTHICLGRPIAAAAHLRPCSGACSPCHCAAAHPRCPGHWLVDKQHSLTSPAACSCRRHLASPPAT
jgi:hypothetical protein